MTTWAEVWEQWNNGNQTGTDICNCGLLPIFGVVIPIVLLVGLVGLVIAAVKFKRQPPP